jgi:rhodanese-related sulfurtransferase
MEKYLIDVRPRADYRDGHIPGSINVPLDEIRTVKRLVPDKKADIYLYCETGRHSGCAKTVLKYLGYKQVTNLGGLEEAEAGLQDMV